MCIRDRCKLHQNAILAKFRELHFFRVDLGSVSYTHLNIEYIAYSSPSSAARELLSDELKNSDICYPDEALLENTDTFINLPQDILDLYDSEWVRLMTN